MKSIKLEKRGKIAIISLHKPEPLNLITFDLLNELYRALAIAKKDDDLRSIVLTGPKNFSAGADLKRLKNFTLRDIEEFSHLGQRVVYRIIRLNKPIIAAIEGYCLGSGLEITLGCDFRIAGKNSKFGIPEINRAIIPHFGGTQILPRLIGSSRSKELLMTGKIVNSQEALSFGILNKVVDDNKILSESFHLANLLAEKSSLALSLIKGLINMADKKNLYNFFKMETHALKKAFDTKDRETSITAFFEKKGRG